MIALFGGSGFIGRALTDRLARDGLPLRVISRRLTTTSSVPAFKHVQADLSEPASLTRALEGCDTLLHLAWSSVPSTAGGDLRADAQINLVGGVNLLEAALVAGVRRVVFLSSGGAVYGRATMMPTPEDHPLRPIGAYGAAKAAMEAYLSVYANQRGLGVTVLRLSNVYGPGQVPFRGQGAVAAFSHRLLAGAPVELWGDGRTIRDYLYIDDAVDAITTSLDWMDSGCTAWNVGSGESVSTLDLIRALERTLGVVALIVHRPARDYDVPVSLLDCTRMRARGWLAQTSLVTGLKLTVERLILNNGAYSPLQPLVDDASGHRTRR